MQNNHDEQTQFFYSRIAGFVYLLLIVMYMSGQFLISSIVGDGGLAAAARHAVASETLYRAALALQVLTSVCTVVLAYALYVTLKPANPRLAHLALLFRLGESFVGGVAMIFSFVQLRIYLLVGAVNGLGVEQGQTLISLARNSNFVGFNMSTLFFSVGSITFFSIFLKSAYLPKVQAQFGIAASVLVVFTSLGGLIFPAYGDTIQLGFIPMFASEIVTGLWLLVRGVRVRGAAHSA